MIGRMFLALALLSYSSFLFATCKEDAGVIGAKYSITTANDGKGATTRFMKLWRYNQQVAHEYLNGNITEVWGKTSNGGLHLVRYFDRDQRGIEYQPGEIKISGTKNVWEIKQQLISSELISNMLLQATEGKGCNKTERYKLKTTNREIQLQWQTNRRLIKSYSEETEHQKVTWELIEIVSVPEQIKNVFFSRTGFQTTDYADVGDNESDPFLMQMINLGFVEHGASGFYDSSGNKMDKPHAHHHHH